MSASYVARQAIYDRHLATVGYELLFRTTGIATEAAIVDQEAATASAIVAALADIGLDTLVGDVRAFVNAGRGFVVDGHIRACPPGRVVVEVLPEDASDPAVLDALRELVADGYSIALDHFVDAGSAGPLLELVSLVKVEVAGMPEDELVNLVDAMRRYPRVEMLAEKVETLEEFERCMLLGFSYFQGHHFSRPQIRKGKVIDPGRLSRMQILASLRSEDTDPARLESLVQRDLGLSHRLMLFINSAHVALPRHIGSIREAIMLLGFRQLRLFADIVVLADCTGDVPMELPVTALVRARMCEQLAPPVGVDADAAFTVGLFSAADSLLGVPMAEVVERLPLSDVTKAALLTQDGPLGAILCTALSYELGMLEPAPGLSRSQCMLAYVEAVSWSAEARRPIARAAA